MQQIGEFLFLECEDLIKRMLTIDPVKRATIEDILHHRWVKVGGEDPEFDRLIAESLQPPLTEDEPMNELVLQHMQSLDISREQTIKVRISFCIMSRSFYLSSNSC